MTKSCTKCGAVKPLEEFSNCKKHKDGKSYACKACASEYHKKWYLLNREQQNQKSAEWRLLNPERSREIKANCYIAKREQYLCKTRAYYRQNKDHLCAASKSWYEANKERMLAACKAWRAAHPESRKASEAKRRAYKLAYEGANYKPSDVSALLKAQEGRCAYCAVTLNATYHVDHIIPLARGGGNGAGNIALACPACNMTKGSKMLGVEWIPPKERKDESQEEAKTAQLYSTQAGR